MMYTWTEGVLRLSLDVVDDLNNRITKMEATLCFVKKKSKFVFVVVEIFFNQYFWIGNLNATISIQQKTKF